MKALKQIKSAAGDFDNLPWEARALTDDLEYANTLIAASADSGSWSRNSAALAKFRSVKHNNAYTRRLTEQLQAHNIP